MALREATLAELVAMIEHLREVEREQRKQAQAMRARGGR